MRSDSSLVELRTVNDVPLAEILRGLLASEGIAAVLFDAGFSGLLGGGFPGIRLMVLQDRLPQAQRILDMLD